MTAAQECPQGDDRLVDAILSVPANRDRFIEAMARAQATGGVKDDPREIERRLTLLLK